jgi:hypothetical protein
VGVSVLGDVLLGEHAVAHRAGHTPHLGLKECSNIPIFEPLHLNRNLSLHQTDALSSFRENLKSEIDFRPSPV